MDIAPSSENTIEGATIEYIYARLITIRMKYYVEYSKEENISIEELFPGIQSSKIAKSIVKLPKKFGNTEKEIKQFFSKHKIKEYDGSPYYKFEKNKEPIQPIVTKDGN